MARSVHRSRPSVFENLSIAAAYNIAKRSLRHDPVFKRARPKWEQFLETRRFKELSGQHPYDNHYLADAIAVLELTRSGLTSPDTTTVVGNQTGAIQAVENLINVRVPQMAGMNGVDVRGRRTFVLSDPPDNPLSYQGLSLGMYARAIHLLGRRASPAARETLKQVAQASWWLTAPDGDLGWYGRSQEESWGVAATAYGAAAAANLPDMVGRRALDMRALTERALNRLKTAYGTGPRGLYITPAVRKALSHAAPGMDGNAGGPSFTGITLMMLNWLQPELRTNPRVGAQIGSDRDGGVQLSVRDARIAVVRHGNVWFGLRMMPSTNRPDDLRYDFGIQVAKLRRGGQWIDLMPVRPNTGVPLSELRQATADTSTDAAGQSPGSRYAPTDSASGSARPGARGHHRGGGPRTGVRALDRPARLGRPAAHAARRQRGRALRRLDADPLGRRRRGQRRVAHRRGGHRAQRGDLRVRADRRRDPHDLPAPGRRRDPVLGLPPGHEQARPPPARDHRPPVDRVLERPGGRPPARGLRLGRRSPLDPRPPDLPVRHRPGADQGRAGPDGVGLVVGRRSGAARGAA